MPSFVPRTPPDAPVVGVRRRLTPLVPWTALVTRLGLAAMFFVSGWNKVSDLEDTVLSVRGYRILPEALIRPFAYGLPLVELAVAVILLLGIGTRLGALLSSALMVMFIVAVSSLWIRGMDVSCGCFGGSSGYETDPVPEYISVIVRDVLLLGISLALARWPRSRLSLDGLLGLNDPAEDIVDDEDS